RSAPCGGAAPLAEADGWSHANPHIAATPAHPPLLQVARPPAGRASEASVTGTGPSAAAALGLPPPSSATGQPIIETSASHVMLVYLDGFGYVRYTEALEADLIPNLAQLDPPLRGITTYPSITSVSRSEEHTSELQLR